MATPVLSPHGDSGALCVPPTPSPVWQLPLGSREGVMGLPAGLGVQWVRGQCGGRVAGGVWHASKPPGTQPGAHRHPPAGSHPRSHQRAPGGAGERGQGGLQVPPRHPQDGGTGWLTGGHCTSLSAAIICTLRCFTWDLPLDLMSRCKTWGGDRGVTAPRGGSQDPPQSRGHPSPWGRTP